MKKDIKKIIENFTKDKKEDVLNKLTNANNKRVIASFLTLMALSAPLPESWGIKEYPDTENSVTDSVDYIPTVKWLAKNTSLATGILGEKIKETIPTVSKTIDIPFTAETYNIRLAETEEPSEENIWENRKRILVEQLMEKESDIISMQEVQTEQLEYIQQNIPDYYKHVEFDRSASKDEQRTVIFYNTNKFALEDTGTFWMSDTPEVKYSNTWGCKTPRNCGWIALQYVGELDKGMATEKGNNYITKDSDIKFGLVVMNVHLDAFSGKIREKSANLLTTYGNKLAEKFASPVILMGDFNCTENSKPYKTIVNNGFLDAKFSADKVLSSGQSYNGWGESSHKLEVDHMFVLGSSTNQINNPKQNVNIYKPNTYSVSDIKTLTYEINNTYTQEMIEKQQSGQLSEGDIIYPSDHYSEVVEYHAEAMIDNER